jgi:hypothetical protein
VEIGGKSRTKSEYGREVDSQLSSQLSDSPRKTPAPANRDLITGKVVNRRVASSNLAGEPTSASFSTIYRQRFFSPPPLRANCHGIVTVQVFHSASRGRNTQTRCHSTFELHSSCAFFQERCVATDRTANFYRCSVLGAVPGQYQQTRLAKSSSSRT